MNGRIQPKRRTMNVNIPPLQGRKPQFRSSTSSFMYSQDNAVVRACPLFSTIFSEHHLWHFCSAIYVMTIQAINLNGKVWPSFFILIATARLGRAGERFVRIPCEIWACSAAYIWCLNASSVRVLYKPYVWIMPVKACWTKLHTLSDMGSTTVN